MKLRSGLILLIIVILAITCIGFFIVTTTVSSPTTMALTFPKESDSINQYSGVKTKLTLILLKDDKIFGYYGELIKEARSVSLDETDKLITDGWQMFSKDSLIVVIKPSEAASYEAIVDILDKMSVHRIEKYSMANLNKQEKEFLKIAE